MRIGVLGTGMVGRTIATKLVALGHEVMMGSRAAGNETAADWVGSTGVGASEGTFADAAAFAELVFNCTAGTASLGALRSVRPADLDGKTIVDVANPLHAPPGMGLSLAVANTDSLGEQIQRAFPDAMVVKTLNTVNHEVMVEPSKAPGEHHVFVCGNDETAKAETIALLESFGWPRERIVDLGDLTAARGMEAYLLLWVRLRGAFGTAHLNVQVRH